MDMGLKGARVLVTAAGSGIGLEIARAFLAEGARVAICDANGAALAALADSEPALRARLCDVSDRASCAEVVAASVEDLGGLDILVNNAGIAGPTAAMEDIPAQEWDRTLAVNLTGTFNVTRLAIPELKKSANASIICMSSGAGRLGFPYRTPYAASKWAVIGMVKSLAMELGPFGIRVNAVLPGSTDGERIQRIIADKSKALGISPAETEQRILAGSSMKKLVPPTQLATTAVFLASSLSNMISGQAICVDGDLQTLV